jgi:hypothetical protein
MDLPMDLPWPLARLVDEAGASSGPDRFLAELGGRLLADGLPLAGGALTLAVPHPIIARRTWLWRAETGAVIEALGFAGGPLGQALAGRAWPGAAGYDRPEAGRSGPGQSGIGLGRDPAVRPRRGRPAVPSRALRRVALSRTGRAGGDGSAARGLSRPRSPPRPPRPLGEHVLRGIAAPCTVFTLPDA